MKVRAPANVVSVRITFPTRALGGGRIIYLPFFEEIPRPAEMRRRKYFVEAQQGAAEAEQRTRRWKKSTESGRSPQRVEEVHNENERRRGVSKEQSPVHLRRLRSIG